MPYVVRAQLDVRLATLRAGAWLGWLSVAAVVVGLALGLPAHNHGVLLALVGAAAVANGVFAAVPRRWWTAARRGEHVLSLWSAGLIALVAALMLVGGGRAQLDLLLFLVLPFLATVHAGRRRVLWLALAFVTGAVAMVGAADPLPAAQLALRLCLLAAATVLALTLADLTRRQVAARAELSARAELEHVLLAESHHRVKNSLQTVADLLLLGRPGGEAGRRFDETAERIRAIAAVHRLLAERRGGAVDAGELLRLVAAGVAPDARVVATDAMLEPTCAQRVAVVANELLANAVRHGRPPVQARLERVDGALELIVTDAGDGVPALADADADADGRAAPPAGGLGLQLVERVVRHGLHGTFTLDRGADRATAARVRFDERTCAS